MDSLSLHTVLAEEAIAIHGETNAIPKNLVGDIKATSAVSEKAGNSLRPDDLYRRLNQLDSAALCLSGGGIRSAAFCLGVIQALAVQPRPHSTSEQNSERAAPDPTNAIANPNESLLVKFHFLSTVSGGGYIGSWLSNWRRNADFRTLWHDLVGRPLGSDTEPATIAWLRAHSNYLTPKLGLLSGDTWVGVAIYLRNLVLNWLIILPLIAALLIALKLLALIAAGIAIRQDLSTSVFVIGVMGILFAIVALRFNTRHRPSRRSNDGASKARDPQGPAQGNFIRWGLLSSGLSAVLLTLYAVSKYGGTPYSALTVVTVSAAGGFVLYGLSWLAAWPEHKNFYDFVAWTVSGVVYGALLGVGAYFYITSSNGFGPFDRVLLPLLFGVPWVLLAQMVAEIIFVGLISNQKDSEADREWLGRVGGWLLAMAVAWIVVSFLTFAGSEFARDIASSVGKSWLASLGGVSGIITALIGKSSFTSATNNQKLAKPLSIKVILAVSATVFAAVMLIAVSAGLDLILLKGSLVQRVLDTTPGLGRPVWWDIARPLFTGLVIVTIVGFASSYFININRFSLHAVYRNRLIRAFLGAARLKRKPDAFTGFDDDDNPRMKTLWPDTKGKDPKRDTVDWRPFHVINVALNIVSTHRLAWQERKAESFTISPLHCGSACKAYRPASLYGDQNGISLGTAMAISGAAASPNMGYHSSPAVTFMLALLNVRLGWWLGNPGDEGNSTYRLDGPRFAIRPLLAETFGLTTDTNPYIYLSDGGHFENLGLYEMVRRRCRHIVVVDAGCDPEYSFEDLGNAVRKCSLDLGITIHFRGLTALRSRSRLGANGKTAREALEDTEANSPPGGGKKLPYFAVGRIEYEAADEGSKDGTILYIKAGYHDDIKNAGVRSYALAHKDFPHQGTGDQWFTESQFESYRALGFEISDGIFNDALNRMKHPANVELDKLFAVLPELVPEVS